MRTAHRSNVETDQSTRDRPQSSPFQIQPRATKEVGLSRSFLTCLAQPYPWDGLCVSPVRHSFGWQRHARLSRHFGAPDKSSRHAPPCRSHATKHGRGTRSVVRRAAGVSPPINPEAHAPGSPNSSHSRSVPTTLTFVGGVPPGSFPSNIVAFLANN